MRVLVVHNRYVSAVPSGENAAVDDDVAALRAAGVEVLTHERSSDEIASYGALAKARLAARPVRSGEDVRAVRALLPRVDVLHLHNPYPLVSPWVVRAAADAGVPVVQTIHNHRRVCVNGSLFRDGHPCADCLRHRTGWPGVVHGCYRGSVPQSLVLTTAEHVHAGTWRKVARYVVLARHTAATLRLPPERVTIRPNATPDPGPPAQPGEGFVFVGRLDAEKGVPLLVAAWRLVPPGASRLTVIGDGRHRADVEALAAERSDVTYLGPRSREEVAAAFDAAAAVVVPSVCAEGGGPRVLSEAYARGRAAVATDVGPLPEAVPPALGWTCPPSPSALATTLVSAAAEAPAKSAAARAHYLAELTPERSLRRLLDAYEAVL